MLSHQQQISMCDKLREIWFKKSEIEDKLKATYLQRNILCPVVMTIIIFITGAALFLVSCSLLPLVATIWWFDLQVIIHIWKMIFYGDEELHSNSFKGGYRNDIRCLWWRHPLTWQLVLLIETWKSARFVVEKITSRWRHRYVTRWRYKVEIEETRLEHTQCRRLELMGSL